MLAFNLFCFLCLVLLQQLSFSIVSLLLRKILIVALIYLKLKRSLLVDFVFVFFVQVIISFFFLLR